MLAVDIARKEYNDWSAAQGIAIATAVSLISKLDMADREDVELRLWEQGKLDVTRRPVPPPPFRGTEVINQVQ